MTVEGVDYTPEGIESVRGELSALREESLKHWPEEIPVTVLLTHAIAQLAYLKELVEKVKT